MRAHLSVDIPHTEANFFALFPSDPVAWEERLRVDAERSGCLRLRIDTLGWGTGNCLIAFDGDDDGDAVLTDDNKLFGVLVGVEKLKEIADAFRLAYEAFSAEES